MVEEAKAIAAFIREGGAYAGLALSILGNLFLYRKAQALQDQLLQYERERREEMLSAQRVHSGQIIQLTTQVMETINALDKSRHGNKRAKPTGGGKRLGEGSKGDARDVGILREEKEEVG